MKCPVWGTPSDPITELGVGDYAFSSPRWLVPYLQYCRIAGSRAQLTRHYRGIVSKATSGAEAVTIG
jgi:hypothetical protein